MKSCRPELINRNRRFITICLLSDKFMQITPQSFIQRHTQTESGRENQEKKKADFHTDGSVFVLSHHPVNDWLHCGLTL